MRILQVITSLLTGGAEHIVVQLAERLSARGVHCDICVFDGEDTPFMHEVERYNEGALKRGLEKVQVFKLGMSFYNPLYIPKLARLMRHYDIVHTHNSSPQLFAAVANSLLPGKCRPRLCTTEHNTTNRKRSWKGSEPVERWMYTRYGHIVCISEIAEEKLRGWLGGGWQDRTSVLYGRISTINNGIDVNAFHTAEPASDLTKLKGDRKAVVMVAGFRKQKDQDTVVRALAHLDKDKCEVWFAGIGERQEQVRRLAKELRVDDRVRFLGLRMDVPGVLRAADVVVMSSHWEGLSLSSVEGMSVDRPFVAGDVNGLREVTKGYGLLFPEGDDKALAGIINRLCTSAGLYKEVADRCYRHALDFDIEHMIDGYVQVYKKAL